jgi:hypothetical protein
MKNVLQKHLQAANSGIKQWGRIKIKAELKNKQISHYCITAAMDEIDDRKYKKRFTSWQ